MENNPNQIKHKFHGAIPLLRKFQKHPYWTERRKYSHAEAWIDLLFMARYGSETEEIYDRGEFIQVQYSQILTSMVTLANRWKRNRHWVRNFINTLVKDGSIFIITMNKRRTILQIVNMGKIKDILQGNEQQYLQQELQQTDNRRTHKNKDNKENKEIIKEVTPINDLFILFKGVNPSYNRLYSNTTERACLERLVKQYGYDYIVNLLTHLPSIVQQPYAPRITTPYELELKMGKLLLYLKQEKNKEQKGGVTKV